MKTLRKLLPWLISIALLLYVASSQDVSGVAEQLGKAQVLRFVVLLLIWSAVTMLLEALFFYVALLWIEGVGSWWLMFRARAASYVLTTVSTVMGYGGMAVFAKKRLGVPYRRGGVLMLNEALHEVGSMGLLALVAGLWVDSLGESTQMFQAQLDGVVLFGAGTFGFYVLCILASRIGKRLPIKKTALALFEEISLPQYGFFLSLKVVQNILHGVWIALALPCFGIEPPALVSMAFTQVVHLVHSLPVSAFGVGVDQLTVPTLFGPWEPAGSAGLLLAFSVVYTFSMIFSRGVLGLPFVSGVIEDMRILPTTQTPGSTRRGAA